jgi:hypothetical protein
MEKLVRNTNYRQPHLISVIFPHTQLCHLPASASRALGLQECSTIPSPLDNVVNAYSVQLGCDRSSGPETDLMTVGLTIPHLKERVRSSYNSLYFSG